MRWRRRLDRLGRWRKRRRFYRSLRWHYRADSCHWRRNIHWGRKRRCRRIVHFRRFFQRRRRHKPRQRYHIAHLSWGRCKRHWHNNRWGKRWRRRRTVRLHSVVHRHRGEPQDLLHPRCHRSCCLGYRKPQRWAGYRQRKRPIFQPYRTSPRLPYTRLCLLCLWGLCSKGGFVQGYNRKRRCFRCRSCRRNCRRADFRRSLLLWVGSRLGKRPTRYLRRRFAYLFYRCRRLQCLRGLCSNLGFDRGYSYRLWCLLHRSCRRSCRRSGFRRSLPQQVASRLDKQPIRPLGYTLGNPDDKHRSLLFLRNRCNSFGCLPERKVHLAWSRLSLLSSQVGVQFGVQSGVQVGVRQSFRWFFRYCWRRLHCFLRWG